ITECDARDVAEAVVETERIRAPSGTRLSLAGSARPVLVLADADKLHQVLTNLVENAVKYSPDGGLVEVLLEPAGDRLRITVRDEGLGIPAGQEERIFRKCYRLAPERTRGVGG